MTETKSARLKRLCDEATQGPWKIKGKDGKYLGGQTGWRADFDRDDATASEKRKFRGISSSIPIMNAQRTQAVAMVVSIDPSYGDDERLEANAAVIAASRTALPELLELNAELVAMLNEVKKTFMWMIDVHGIPAQNMVQQAKTDIPKLEATLDRHAAWERGE